jgi:tannase/feruloyl esterase
MKSVLCGLLLAAVPLFAADCESLAKLNLPNTTIAASQVPAGAFPGPPPQTGQQAADYKSLPAFCRVQGTIRPSQDSDISFEIWLPAARWNGRYEGLGNGGFAGSIDYGGLADAVAHGYAASDTDTGHKGSPIDAAWALGHPEKVVDFGYRAVHLTAQNARAIISAFYRSAPRHSYFSSCSDGGREALMEAQRYPEDYDGILAGAPANYWTHLLAAAVSETQLLSDSAHAIPAAKVPAVQSATLNACDALDGVRDGVIEDPSRCKFDPAQLLCKNGDSNTCLTAPQVESLRKLYQGARDSGGHQIFPGRMPGGEVDANGWILWITGAGPNHSLMYSFGTGFFADMVFDNPSWDYHRFQADRDTKAADDKLGSILNATDPDLSRFHSRGGKLIIYHGWNDPAISPLNSINYFRSVEAKLGTSETSDFARLYLAPGMAHCGGGPGPDSFGQNSVAPAAPGHSVTKALERWVETGTAPGPIVAAKYKPPSPRAVRSWPLCPYPQVARYSGTGSSDEASNFSCVTP